MKENVSLYANQQLKASQDLKQGIPSSFSVNQEYFNARLVRIKEKIDRLIKQNMSLDFQSMKSIDKNLNGRQEQSGGLLTSQTMMDSFGRPRQMLPAQKITEQMKQNIQKIYNQIHLLEVTATKDENMIETNTFELKSFLKDLRNQEKRLTKILPDGIVFELESQKKKTFKKSEIIKGEIETILEGFETADTIQKQEEQQKKIKQANEQIKQSQKKRRIFKENELYYQDEKSQKCDLLKCQLI